MGTRRAATFNLQDGGWVRELVGDGCKLEGGPPAFAAHSSRPYKAAMNGAQPSILVNDGRVQKRRLGQLPSPLMLSLNHLSTFLYRFIAGPAQFRDFLRCQPWLLNCGGPGFDFLFLHGSTLRLTFETRKP